MLMTPSIFGNDLFNDFFDDFAPAKSFSGFRTPASSLMKTDVKESDSGFELSVELPGYDKESIRAELKEGYLTISAGKSESKEEKDKDGSYIRRERYQGSCSRTFYVGEDITKDDIKARFNNGVLILDIPKKDPQPKVEEAKFIQIEG